MLVPILRLPPARTVHDKMGESWTWMGPALCRSVVDDTSRRRSAVVTRTEGRSSEEDSSAMLATETCRMFDGCGRFRTVGTDGAFGDQPVCSDVLCFS